MATIKAPCRDRTRQDNHTKGVRTQCLGHKFGAGHGSCTHYLSLTKAAFNLHELGQLTILELLARLELAHTNLRGWGAASRTPVAWRDQRDSNPRSDP